MNGNKEIKNIALELLNKNLEPIQTYIILKDLLDIPQNDSLMIKAKEKIKYCHWVKELEETQESNGSWGRFHSQDSTLKKKFPTTEIAINRALALGLDVENIILDNAVNYMVRILNGELCWSDRVEKFNEWPATTRMITASTLSRIVRTHPALIEAWEVWAEIVSQAFKSGCHNLDKEIATFKDCTGIYPTKKDSKLNKMYPLILLSATDKVLSFGIQKSYLEWIWNQKEGIYYLTNFGIEVLPEITSKEFPFWIRAIDIISDYSYGKELIRNSVEYLWGLKGNDCFWDFGPNSGSAMYAKQYCGWNLASSWREALNRKIDCTLRILLLLKKCSS